jgi:hypothetical protein
MKTHKSLLHLLIVVLNIEGRFYYLIKVGYQDTFTLFGIWVFDSWELRIGIFLLGNGLWRTEVKSLESRLHEVMTNTMDRSVHKLYFGLLVHTPRIRHAMAKDTNKTSHRKIYKIP